MRLAHPILTFRLHLYLGRLDNIPDEWYKISVLAFVTSSELFFQGATSHDFVRSACACISSSLCKEFSLLVHISQAAIVASVRGIVTAQYTQNRLFITWLSIPACQSNIDVEKSEETKVPGRKTTVTAANVFIDVESCLQAVAMVLESRAREMVTLVSICVMRLKS